MPSSGPVSFTGTTKYQDKSFVVTSPPVNFVVAAPFTLKVEGAPVKLKPGDKAKLKVTAVRKGGYDGPIKMLVGMDTSGVITGIIVADHREPYGYFSVDPPDFPAQFKGKSIRDPFEVGTDVDVISRATITTRAAAREIRESARMVARAVLKPEDVR